MEVWKSILSLFPSHKQCGCDESTENETGYQFRVKAQYDDEETNLFQVREKHICTECGDETVNVLVEDKCDYDPSIDIHNRKVGVDDDDMVDYGFMDKNEMVRMLVEMRLSQSLEL